ncbi:hypothetical protein LTR97_000856 [Elasticomyces elasticus]|uniref:ZZ-type domain-containing protein n=1 Tax=Elasticomyces elasticus TaxID=574655 RepID=A0AAN7WRE8_9PEZI|nr:hypothetical protein LTR97_000856 [Elasticomyces elasticus]
MPKRSLAEARSASPEPRLETHVTKVMEIPIRAKHTFFVDEDANVTHPTKRPALHYTKFEDAEPAVATLSDGEIVYHALPQQASLVLVQKHQSSTDSPTPQTAGWLRGQGVKVETDAYAATWRSKDEDGESESSGDTVRPSTRQIQYQAAPNSIVSDADNPTVASHLSTVLPPQNIKIAQASREWQIEQNRKGRFYFGKDGLEHRMHLQTIEKFWGGPINQIIPTDIRPLASVCSATRLVDPMDWDRKMVKTLRKVAPMCCLKEFLMSISPMVKRRRENGGEAWMSFADVLFFYEGLKKEKRQARTLADVERDGPAIDKSGGTRKTAPPDRSLPYKPGYESGATYKNTEFCCDDCTTYFESGLRVSCNSCSAEFCMSCSHESGKHGYMHLRESVMDVVMS